MTCELIILLSYCIMHIIWGIILHHLLISSTFFVNVCRCWIKAWCFGVLDIVGFIAATKMSHFQMISLLKQFVHIMLEARTKVKSQWSRTLHYMKREILPSSCLAFCHKCSTLIKAFDSSSSIIFKTHLKKLQEQQTT